MSAFNRFTNKFGKTMVDFQAVLHEEASNTSFNLYSNGKVTTMDNSEYDKPANSNMFRNDKPFWIAKAVVSEPEAMEYLQANFNTEMYNGKLNFKCIKRKYMPTVLPPMFFDANRNKMNGTIAKGSLVNIRAQEEEYTTKDKATGKPVTAKKLTLLGVSILEDNASTGAQEVVCNNQGSELDGMLQAINTLTGVVNQLQAQNKKIMSDTGAIIDGLIETRNTLKDEIAGLKTELDSVKEELKIIKTVAPVKEDSCKVEDKSLQCEKETNNGVDMWDDMDMSFFDEAVGDEQPSTDTVKAEPEDEDFDDIPF